MITFVRKLLSVTMTQISPAIAPGAVAGTIFSHDQESNVALSSPRAVMLGMHQMLKGLFAGFFVCALGLSVANAATDKNLSETRIALDKSQAALGNTLSSLEFTDRRNQKINLVDLMDKPLIISLIYTGCIDVCPMISEHLADAIEVAKDAVGEDAFRVVSIGFDAQNDTPERMRMYAAERGLNVRGWDFLSANADTIDQLSRDLGFTFNPSPQGYDHMTQTSVIDTDGRVYRHVYGADFDAPLIVEPLKQLVYGGRIEMTSVEGLINRIKLFCTVYDPATGSYKFDYSLFISIILGGLSMATVGVVLARSWFSLHRRRRFR